MIRLVRDMLGITTELVYDAAAGAARAAHRAGLRGRRDRVRHRAGAAAYFGEDAEERFAAAGIKLAWSKHQATTGDSIVTCCWTTTTRWISSSGEA